MAEIAARKPVEVERIGHAVVARPQNKLIDDQDVKSLAQKVEELGGEESDVTVVVIDLAKVAIVPSMVLGLLTQVNYRCTARKQQLKLARVQPQVMKVFAATHLDKVFQFTQTVEEALQ